MFLHQNIKTFEEIIENTHRCIGINKSLIEKDYYVFLLLKLIVHKQTNDKDQEIVFKGGTSLSKAYNIIQRFSEDIDLCLPQDKIKSAGARKRLTNAITTSINDLGLELYSIRNIERSGVYNDIRGNYNSITSDAPIESYIKVETVHRIKEYPVEKRLISSYITDYINTHIGNEALQAFHLEPFYVNTVSLYRTFIDKLFAIADYYLEDKVTRYSRHIYDLYKLINTIDWNNIQLVGNLRELLNQVQLERQPSKGCLSAQQNVDLAAVIYQSLTTDFYMQDYMAITQYILLEQVDYYTCKQAILKLLQSKILL